MIKLRFSLPVYKTYNGGKVTTCLYKCVQVDTKEKRVLEEFTVQGKAICSSQDTPNERTGRIIAESRAKLLAYKKVACSQSLLRDYENTIDSMAEYVLFQYKMARCRHREIDHLKILTQ